MSDTTLIERPRTTAHAPSSASATPAGTSATARPVLCFARTASGSAQLKQPSLPLTPQATRLLMLFEEPQTIDELRRIIDEPWLPEALIELERRKLIRRDSTRHAARPAGTGTAAMAPHTLRPDPAHDAATRLARQRAQARILFLQQIGRLSTLMIDRIESCQSEAELQRLTPAFADLLATPASAGNNTPPVA